MHNFLSFIKLPVQQNHYSTFKAIGVQERVFFPKLWVKEKARIFYIQPIKCFGMRSALFKLSCLPWMQRSLHESQLWKHNPQRMSPLASINSLIRADRFSFPNWRFLIYRLKTHGKAFHLQVSLAFLLLDEETCPISEISTDLFYMSHMLGCFSDLICVLCERRQQNNDLKEHISIYYGVWKSIFFFNLCLRYRIRNGSQKTHHRTSLYTDSKVSCFIYLKQQVLLSHKT